MTEYQVAASADDGRQIGGGSGDIDITGVIIRIASSAHYALCRWTGINAYANRKVQTATISLYTKTYLTAKFSIYFEDAASPAALATTANNIGGRSLTTANVSIDETATDETWWTSPNLKTALQEVIDTHGTVSTVAIILDCLSGGDYGFRSEDHDSALAAKLNLVFTTVTAAFTGSPLTGLYESQVDEVTFNNTSSTDAPGGFTGGASGWLWEHKKDAGSWTTFSTLQNPTLGSLTAGTYSIRLTVTSNDGSSNTLTQTDYFTVTTARTATADFSADITSGVPGSLINFTDISGTDDPDNIIGWQWDRKLNADTVWSTFSVVQNPTNIAFNTQGDWDVRLIVTTAVGATDTETKSNYISISSIQISVFRPYGAPGPPLDIPAKPPARPLIPIPVSTGVGINVLIADVNNRILGEMACLVHKVPWILNGIGEAKFSIARSDPLATEEFLRFGNRMLLQFDNGLPNWGGVIDTPRDWPEGAIEFTAYGAEKLLFFRKTPRKQRFYQATVGAIYTALIQAANAIFPTGVRVGKVWYGGELHSPEYNLAGLGDVFTNELIGKLVNGAWDVTAYEDAGQIIFEANLYQQKGALKPNVALLQDVNVSVKGFAEQGPIINKFHTPGEGDSWDESRPIGAYEDTDSRKKYGLREGVEMLSDVSLQSTLDAVARNRTDQTSAPVSVPDLRAANLAPALYSRYGLGDSPWLELPDYGFGGGFAGFARLLAREFVPSDGVCDLVLESV